VRNIRTPPPPPPSEESAFLAMCYNVATSPAVEASMIVVTLSNVILLMLVHDGQSSGFSVFIDIASNVFTALFAAEAALKILGLRPFW
jgi:hypothetical protein